MKLQMTQADGVLTYLIIIRELNDLAQADWFMLDMQPMSLLPCIYMAG